IVAGACWEGGRNHQPRWASCMAKLRDRLEPCLRRRRARLQDALQSRVERSHGNIYRYCIACSEIAQNIDIAHNKAVLSNDRHRVAKFSQLLEAPACDAQRFLDWSI